MQLCSALLDSALFTDEAIDAGNQIDVAYDATRGFPARTQTDVLEAMVDGSVGYFITDFTPLPYRAKRPSDALTRVLRP